MGTKTIKRAKILIKGKAIQLKEKITKEKKREQKFWMLWQNQNIKKPKKIRCKLKLKRHLRLNQKKSKGKMDIYK